MTTIPVAEVAGMLSVVWALGPSGPVLAQSTAGLSAASVAPCTLSPDITFDTEGDIDNDQTSDRVVGVPSAVAGSVRAGVVDIHLSRGRNQRVGEAFFAGVPAAGGDAFGSQVQRVDLDSDRCQDLAISSPGSAGGRGAVLVARGSESGLRSDGTSRLLGKAAGEHFGAAVLAGGFAECETREVVIGAPGEDIGRAADAGTVTLVGTPLRRRVYYQGRGSLGGAAETGDRLGSSLERLDATADSLADFPDPDGLVIGVPGESVGTAVHAGGVAVLQLLHPQVPDSRIEVTSFGDSGGRTANERYGQHL